MFRGSSARPRRLSRARPSELWDAADLAGVERLSNKLLDEDRPEIYLPAPRPRFLRASRLHPYLGRAGRPLRAADLGKASAKSPGNVNVLLGRLTEAGALYRIRKGEYEYTASKFRDFLLRR